MSFFADLVQVSLLSSFFSSFGVKKDTTQENKKAGKIGDVVEGACLVCIIIDAGLFGAPRPPSDYPTTDWP